MTATNDNARLQPGADTANGTDHANDTPVAQSVSHKPEVDLKSWASLGGRATPSKPRGKQQRGRKWGAK